MKKYFGIRLERSSHTLAHYKAYDAQAVANSLLEENSHVIPGNVTKLTTQEKPYGLDITVHYNSRSGRNYWERYVIEEIQVYELE